MTELIEKVKEAKKVLADSQKDLLAWCRDKSISINDRYPIWVQYIDKLDHCDTGVSMQPNSLLQDFVDYFTDHSQPERHEVISYAWLRDVLYDIYRDNPAGIDKILNKHTVIIRDSKIDSILSDTKSTTGVVTKGDFDSILKEEFVAENFGSFEFDW